MSAVCDGCRHAIRSCLISAFTDAIDFLSADDRSSPQRASSDVDRRALLRSPNKSINDPPSNFRVRRTTCLRRFNLPPVTIVAPWILNCDIATPPQTTSHSNHTLQMYTMDRQQTIFIYIFYIASCVFDWSRASLFVCLCLFACLFVCVFACFLCIIC